MYFILNDSMISVLTISNVSLCSVMSVNVLELDSGRVNTCSQGSSWDG